MRTSDNMKGTLADIASLVKDEFKTISTSYAILLVLVGGIFLYGLLYNYMYAPDLVRNAPVVVVDDSKTSQRQVVSESPTTLIYHTEFKTAEFNNK